MTLPDTLKKLAERLPKRFCRIENWPEAWWAVWDKGELGWVSMGDSDIRLSRLEYALREECEARGWNWEVSRKGQNPDGTWQYWGSIWHPFRSRPEVHQTADTPAEALALAMVAALEGEG